MTRNKTLADEAGALADFTKGFADRLRYLAEDWAELQKWAEKAEKNAKDAEKAARSRWAREGKSEGLSALVYTAAEAIVSESQDLADRGHKWAEATQMITQQARLVARQAKRKRKD